MHVAIRLPTTLYQINTKFRDEIRPRFGVMRAREFTMKDAYSFHVTKQCLDETYQDMYECYEAILKRCKLNYIIVEADGGAIAGSDSKTHEFQVLAENGEDEVIYSEKDNFAANIEAAVTKRSNTTVNLNKQKIEVVSTPDTTTIESVCTFLKYKLEHSLKALAYKVVKGDKSKVMIMLLLGDDTVNEIKIKNHLAVDRVELLSDLELKEAGLIKGFAGPVGLEQAYDIILDSAVDPKEVLFNGC